MSRVAVACLSAVLVGMLSGCGQPERSQRQLSVEQECDAARNTCFAGKDGERIGLTLGPNIQPLRPFEVDVELSGALRLDAAQVSVDFDMVGMEMGENRYRLSRTSIGRWHGSAMLPICVAGRADWIALVEITTAQERLGALFTFHTER